MFAILFTDKMDIFYGNVTSFPTVIFTVLVLICLFYWLIAIVGLVNFDFLNLDVPDADVDMTDGVANHGLFAGLLLKLGLAGIPLPIMLTVLSLVGWVLSYYAVHFIFPFVPGALLEFVFGVVILVVTLYVSAVLTGKITKPLRPLFQKMNQNVKKTILGKVAVVRTTKVDKIFGEADIDDGGAGLIIKVRSYRDEVFARGDKVVLLEYDEVANIYKVISEKEFNNS